LQLHITESLICFESYGAIIRDTNNREQGGRQVEAASRGRGVDTQEDRQSGADGLRQPRRNREAEAENGRQSRMPVWVEVGRIILARGRQEEACSHIQLGRHTEAGRKG
jgi:hypothetical protein